MADSRRILTDQEIKSLPTGVYYVNEGTGASVYARNTAEAQIYSEQGLIPKASHVPKSHVQAGAGSDPIPQPTPQPDEDKKEEDSKKK